MKCPYCFTKETKVVDKRESGEKENEIRRRRECLKCHKRFTTYEKLAEADILVVKKDGRREPFSREKIRNGVMKSCEKRPVSQEQIDKIVNEIDEKVRNKGKEVSSSLIGELIMEKLKKLDNIAYVRFASVYKEFADVSDFKDLLNEIRKK
ncbi:transcriptional regulator NrdR [Candidatus Pacearchaeota archaeon CG06_land_8_20_14_3_00_35_12]|nr:MAG: transcriptional regulator NrdR [Candidatus Pacearchaeota archaeon CG06_land_8_20_14_3_00_35_12]